jgi:pimeloyl-ACP methyl ester carboxylesterase
MPQPVSERIVVDAADVTLVGDVWTADPAHGRAILLHGGGQTRHSWGSACSLLAARGWTAAAYDARGHGESDWSPRGAYTADDRLRDLRAVVPVVSDEPPVLIGASMGGLTSLLAAGEIPGFAQALVLVDVVPRIEPSGISRIASFMTSRPDGFESLEEAAEAVRAYNPHRSRPVNVAGLHKNLRQRRDGRWYWHWDPASLSGGRREIDRAGHVARLRAAAAALDVPTLLVRGAQSDVVSDEGVADLLSLNPDALVRDVLGTGHMVAGDDNTAFADALLSFLDDLVPA